MDGFYKKRYGVLCTKTMFIIYGPLMIPLVKASLLLSASHCCGIMIPNRNQIILEVK